MTAFTDRALRDPHVDAVSSTEPPDDVVLELVDGLTPITRDRLAARLRREPAVMSARVVD